MKKHHLILLFLSLFGLISCVKQKDCACGYTGTWQYLEEPYFRVERKIVAIITDHNYESAYGLYITGAVPKQFTSLSPIRISFCVDRVSDNRGIILGYKLQCLEKVK